MLPVTRISSRLLVCWALIFASCAAASEGRQGTKCGMIARMAASSLLWRGESATPWSGIASVTTDM